MKIGVVGATGVVGRALLDILEERKFGFQDLKLFASDRSVGKEIQCGGKEYACQKLEPGCFEGLDLVFFDVPDDCARKWVPQASREVHWIVDNSAAYRYEPDSIIIVPEVNGDQLKTRLQKRDLKPEERIFTVPNCSTAQMVMALKPLDDAFKVARLVVSTYQSTSGGGALAVDELREQTRAWLDGHPPEQKDSKQFPHPIAFNCLPQVGGFRDDEYTGEEHKMVIETRLLLDRPEMPISATCVRVPTLNCHGESLNIEFEKPFDVPAVRKLLQDFPGIVVQDDPKSGTYPLGANAAGKDEVFVGRIRKDPTRPNALNLWVVSDNLRKGAALNAVQIGEQIRDLAFS